VSIVGILEGHGFLNSLLVFKRKRLNFRAPRLDDGGFFFHLRGSRTTLRHGRDSSNAFRVAFLVVGDALFAAVLLSFDPGSTRRLASAGPTPSGGSLRWLLVPEVLA
jgi:hypothetical protein